MSNNRSDLTASGVSDPQRPARSGSIVPALLASSSYEELPGVLPTGTPVTHATVEVRRKEGGASGWASKAASPLMRGEGGGKQRGVRKPSPFSSKFMEAVREKEEEPSQMTEEKEMQDVKRYRCLVSDEVAHILRPGLGQEEHESVEKEYDSLLLLFKHKMKSRIFCLVGGMAAVADCYWGGFAPPADYRMRRSMARAVALLCRILVDR